MAKKPVEEKTESASIEEIEIDYLQVFGLPKSVLGEVEKIAVEKKLSKEQKEKLLEHLKKKYDLIKVEPGEAVGIVTAQSLGEPATQLTLKTKHYAGAAEVSVGTGIQRVEEIVDARSRAKHPTMTIFLNEDLRTFEKTDSFAKSLIDVRIGDVIKVTEDLNNKTAEVKLLKEEINARGIKVQELVEKIEKNAKAKTKTLKEGLLELSFGKEALLKIRKQLLKMLATRIQGVRGIEKTIIVKEKNAQGIEEFVIKTSGTNLKTILKMPEVDGSRTTTNDIKEINRVLGIEAGRQAIVEELFDVLVKKNDILVDVRHILLLADMMTFDGEVKGIVRSGITHEKASPFARAAFEETTKHLLEAAFKGEKELLQGVVENIIVGQPIKVGTGIVQLIMK